MGFSTYLEKLWINYSRAFDSQTFFLVHGLQNTGNIMFTSRERVFTCICICLPKGETDIIEGNDQVIFVQ